MTSMNSPTAAIDQLDASVIVCTYNRSWLLARTLESLSKQQLKASTSWEVVVVDNNSSDDTHVVVEQAQKSFPLLRYEFEGNQGLSNARNHGVLIARGRILLFTDDDVCPEPDWIQQMLDGFTQYGCDACGGYIAPAWEVPPPTWLTERFYGFLAVRTSDKEIRPILTMSDVPYGANMAFRREVFERIGLFDITRGRKGNILASGEDGELFERLLADGGKIMFLPQVRVHHRVEAFRLKKSYFRRWRFQTSRNLAQSRGVPGKRRLLGIPLYLFPQLFRALVTAFRGRFALPYDEAFYKEIIVWHFLGLINGLWNQRRAQKNSDSKSKSRAYRS